MADVSAIVLSAAQQAHILAEAREAHPFECCGLLTGVVEDGAARVREVLPALNVAAAPERAFEIDPRTLIQAHRGARERGEVILGWYHSHPTGLAMPSACDAERAAETGKVWIIVAQGDAAAYVSAEQGDIAGRFLPLPLRVISPA